MPKPKMTRIDLITYFMGVMITVRGITKQQVDEGLPQETLRELELDATVMVEHLETNKMLNPRL